MNFGLNVLATLPAAAPALVSIDTNGARRAWSADEIGDASARCAGALAEHGVGRGDVVLTLIGNRPEWVLVLMACWRIGAVALPCNEQLRGHDLAVRIETVPPRLVVADERNLATVRAAGWDGELLTVPGDSLLEAAPAPAADLGRDDPALVIFTSGTAGEPKPVRHGVGYLFGQRVQAEHWFGARPGDLCWCTAASGWSKSARNAFVAPWVRGATALVQDRRFDPEERLATIESEGVNVLCMAPTEYRAIAKRARLRPLPSVRHAVAAGEPLNPEIVEIWRAEAGVVIHDGYGQTETGALTGMPIGEPVRPGSMGKPLPGFRLWIDDGELCADPATVPTMTLDAPAGPWRTGDRVSEDADGYLWFEGRADDVIISAGYRIGPFEVESALVSHPAVAEAAAVAAPDEVRGAVVRAIVVPAPGVEPSDELARELQEHVKEQTAPYKYPRIIEFSSGLPKTASGKIKRAELRDAQPAG